MIRAVGIAIVLAGLLLVGISGDNARVANARHIGWGALLMLVGTLVALFAGEIGLATGLERS